MLFFNRDRIFIRYKRAKLNNGTYLYWVEEDGKNINGRFLRQELFVRQELSELGSSNKEASPSAGKNTGVVLVPCSRMEVRPYSYFRWFGYF